jgi:hypothetical protein
MLSDDAINVVPLAGHPVVVLPHATGTLLPNYTDATRMFGYESSYGGRRTADMHRDAAIEGAVDFDEEKPGGQKNEGQQGDEQEEAGIADGRGVEEGVGIFAQEEGEEGVPGDEGEREQKPGEGVFVGELASGDASVPEDEVGDREDVVEDDINGDLEAGRVPLPPEEGGVDEFDDKGVDGGGGGERWMEQESQWRGGKGHRGEGEGKEEIGEDGEELEEGEEAREETCGGERGDAKRKVEGKGEPREHGEKERHRFTPSTYGKKRGSMNRAGFTLELQPG